MLTEEEKKSLNNLRNRTLNILREELYKELHKYFTGLIHYQYDVNHEQIGAEEKLEEQRRYLDNKFSIWFESKLQQSFQDGYKLGKNT